MTNQTLKTTGYFDREIDLSAKTVAPSGVPAAIVGASLKGPAFVPVTVGSISDFESKFGALSPKYPAPYAADKWLTNQNSCTFIRVLGAGANSTQVDFNDTLSKGIVKNAGFKISGSAVSATDRRHQGTTQFIVAKHTVTGSEVFGMPMFSDNQSFFTTGSTSEVYLVRAALFTAYDTRVMVLSSSETFTGTLDDFSSLDLGASSPMFGKFKLAISSSAGTSFASTDGFAGVRILTASLNPSNEDYIGKILNTDPDKFETERHLLYCDFAVDSELATVSTTANVIGVVSGSANTSSTSGDTALTLRDAFGRFDTRFTTPQTPWFVSQPFGQTEHNLFYVESLDDGAYANNKYKISILALKASSDPKNEYGTFSLSVRDFNDTDVEPRVIEQYNNLSLDPESDNYIAKIIGDVRVTYSFDTLDTEDRRLVKDGSNSNRSKLIRVVMNEQVDRKMLPANVLPFGFRGFNVLNTSNLLTDALPTGGISGSLIRMAASGTVDHRMLSAILPPVPYRFKVTRGDVSTGSGFEGLPGPNEVVDSRYFWGVKTERNTNVLNPNVSNESNALVAALTKFQGISKLDTLVTGSRTDSFNNNKFTLARVCLSNISLSDITASVDTHMREAAYIRNGVVDPSDYTITDVNGARVTFATLLSKGTTVSEFNKFSEYAKFTTVMAGGFDGTNILDKHAAKLTDRATSTEAGGGANGSYLSPGFSLNQSGVGKLNGAIYSYRTAVQIITNPMNSLHSILAIPGIREPFVTDEAMASTLVHNLSFYVNDIQYYDFNASRVYDGDIGKYIDVEKTADVFESRAVDQRVAAAYFPNIIIDDRTNKRKVLVPASVGALAAIAYSDRVSFPWFAPAGFNRAALDFVSQTQVRVNQPEINRLIETRINPIVKIPREAFVITAQNTLQQANTAQRSINVVRMLLEVKRAIVEIGNQIIFNSISASTREEFVKQCNATLGSIQVKSGIEMFKVVSDDSNNSEADVNANRIYAQITIVPTRAVENISLDFIITQSGVQFL